MYIGTRKTNKGMEMLNFLHIICIIFYIYKTVVWQMLAHHRCKYEYLKKFILKRGVLWCISFGKWTLFMDTASPPCYEETNAFRSLFVEAFLPSISNFHWTKGSLFTYLSPPLQLSLSLKFLLLALNQYSSLSNVHSSVLWNIADRSVLGPAGQANPSSRI
jgi:hypothetical protein